MSVKTALLKFLLPVVIVLAGFAGMKLLVLSRPAPVREARETPGVLVEVFSVQRVDRPVLVTGTGTVGPRQEADITPQVSGRITYIAPGFVAGGFFKEGDLLFRIEDTDYRLVIERAKAALAKAEFDLATVKSQARVARVEWERLKVKEGSDPNPLVLYEPQLKNARAGVDSANAALRQAELDLERTSVYAPFPCLVRKEEADLGQYVSVGRSVATVAGTDSAEIVVPLPLGEMQWLRIPREESQGKGSPAIISLTVGGRTLTWKSRVVRSLGEVDPLGRMARAVVAVEDPYNLEKRNRNNSSNLEFGTFVDVEITGRKLTGIYVVPRRALRDDDTVWTVDNDMKLRVKPVTILRRERENLILRDSFKENELVVLTNIPGAADGMKLRLVGEGAAE